MKDFNQKPGAGIYTKMFDSSEVGETKTFTNSSSGKEVKLREVKTFDNTASSFTLKLYVMHLLIIITRRVRSPNICQKRKIFVQNLERSVCMFASVGTEFSEILRTAGHQEGTVPKIESCELFDVWFLCFGFRDKQKNLGSLIFVAVDANNRTRRSATLLNKW